ncbi:MAG TPA: hypothetical protein VLW54_10770 [Candidatus Acidoferrales bacterium]|nr:hypothetical protein [Candidatus Acidoferrales bacterium]
MGSFYVNMTAKGPTQSQVLALLSQLGRNAFVLPTADGFTTFCDEAVDTQDDLAIRGLAQDVSRRLQCAVFAVLNHDDDILWYALFANDELLDEYDSFPTYFEGIFSPPKGGDAALLCKVIGSRRSETDVAEILRKPHNAEGYVLETDRHAALAEALGLPSFSVGFGYRYLEMGELPEGLEETQMRRT